MPHRARAGFTFLEIVVAVGITAIIGATVYATLGGARDRQRVDDSYAILRELTRVIDRFDSLTGGVANGRHPQYLSQLNNAITVTPTANCLFCKNICDVAHTSNQTPGWSSNGPFYQSRDITAGTGMRIPIGLVRDLLIREPVSASADQAHDYGVMKVQIDGVDYLDALDLELIVDSLPDPSKGVVRWTATPVDGVLSSIFWTLPIAGC